MSCTRCGRNSHR